MKKRAHAAGAQLQQWIGRFSVREKGPADLVTDADCAAQEEIRRIVMGAFPGHAFLGEEDAQVVPDSAEYCWIVDPLDGTTNFVHGCPCYSVSIAVAHRGRPVAGVVFDPNAKELFTAEAGGGARLNGAEITVSGVEHLGEALVAVSFPPAVDRASGAVDQFLAVLERAQAMRRTGSAALNLAYLASGRYDGYWSTTTKPWDVAAGALIVEEAGGVLTSFEGGEFDVWHPRFIAASTAALHGELLRALGTGE